MMSSDPFASLRSVSKVRVMREYLDMEHSDERNRGLPRSPTLALRLALSVAGGTPKEGFIPLRFFSENDIQVYLGPPNHPLGKLLRFTGETTSLAIAKKVFPDHLEKRMTFKERYKPAHNLPADLRDWFHPIPIIIKKIMEGNWDPPPIHVLNFSPGKLKPWIIRAEHFCGQVPDGSHRVLAYTLLGSEFPEIPIRVRVLKIHLPVLAITNGITLGVRFLMDPFHSAAFIKKRFGGSAFFPP